MVRAGSLTLFFIWSNAAALGAICPPIFPTGNSFHVFPTVGKGNNQWAVILTCPPTLDRLLVGFCHSFDIWLGGYGLRSGFALPLGNDKETTKT